MRFVAFLAATVLVQISLCRAANAQLSLNDHFLKIPPVKVCRILRIPFSTDRDNLARIVSARAYGLSDNATRQEIVSAVEEKERVIYGLMGFPKAYSFRALSKKQQHEGLRRWLHLESDDVNETLKAIQHFRKMEEMLMMRRILKDSSELSESKVISEIWQIADGLGYPATRPCDLQRGPIYPRVNDLLNDVAFNHDRKAPRKKIKNQL